MAALTLPDSAFCGGNSGNDVDNAPSLEVEWNTERTQFRVNVDQVSYGWFAHSASNRKAVLVLLRHMYDSLTGRRLFTEEQRAALLGSTNRQAVDGHMKGFREADEDMGKFLSRTRKVDAEVVELVWKSWSADQYTDALVSEAALKQT